MNKKVEQFLNDLKSADYCCKQIIALNLDLEVLNHKMLGMSCFHPEISKEQEKINKPMPTFHGGGNRKSYCEWLFEEEKIISEINYYRRRLNECKPIELLSLSDQNILFELYFWSAKSWDVAAKYGYSRKGLWKHIRTEISKLL